MKSILKTVLSLAAASAAATAVLTISVIASAESAGKSSIGLEYKTGMWQGRFTVNDVAKFSSEFNEPKSFAFYVNGTSLTLTGKYPYEGNYKTAVITLKAEKSTNSEATPYGKHNNKATTVKTTYSGILRNGQYYGFMYDGTSDTSSIYEKATVAVAQPGYMPFSDSDPVK